jgi:DNA polymerase III alpha subunit
MATKSAIRDTRVLDLPLFEADKIAKLIQDDEMEFGPVFK